MAHTDCNIDFGRRIWHWVHNCYRLSSLVLHILNFNIYFKSKIIITSYYSLIFINLHIETTRQAQRPFVTWSLEPRWAEWSKRVAPSHPLDPLFLCQHNWQTSAWSCSCNSRMSLDLWDRRIDELFCWMNQLNREIISLKHQPSKIFTCVPFGLFLIFILKWDLKYECWMFRILF